MLKYEQEKKEGYFFELIDTDKERGMVKIRYVIEDWIDKEGAQRLIARIQSE